MKTIITFLFSFGIFATSFSQDNRHQSNRDDRYVYTQREHSGRGNFSQREKEFQIAKINREFEFKIRAIRNDYRLRHHQKKVAIRNAEREKNTEIKMVNRRFYSAHSRHSKHEY